METTIQGLFLCSNEHPLQIHGFILIEKYSQKYKIPAGLYPVIYFEERSVQIPIPDEHDFMWIEREHIDEWIKVSEVVL